MPIRVDVPRGAIACRPVACAVCTRQTSLVLVDDGEFPRHSSPTAKCLSCRFREALRADGVSLLRGLEASARFPTGPTFLSSLAGAELDRKISRYAMRTKLRLHAEGDFGRVGRFDPGLATEDARDLGVLASRPARNAIALIDGSGDVLSIHESDHDAVYGFWTILGRDRATIVFGLTEDVGVY